MESTAKQDNPTMLRNNEQPGILTFIHNIALPQWRAMDAAQKQSWVAFNLRYMMRQLDRLAASLPKEA